MKLNKIILASALMLGFLPASAQDAAEKPQYDFKGHWYIEAMGGAQYTLGETDFGNLISPNAQIAAGYEFNPNIGLRLSVNAWQSMGGSEPKIVDKRFELGYRTWKWNYVAPTVDVVLNLSNIIAGRYNPKRVYNLSVFAGIGANFAWNNDEAGEVKADYESKGEWVTGFGPLRYYWEDNRTSIAGKFGLINDFRITDKWRIELELNASTVDDHYNSKKAGNSDWYFNALAGVKYHFGHYVSKREPRRCDSETIYVEKPVVKEVIKEVVKEVVKDAPLRRDVFFAIASSKITNAEMQKVEDIVTYLKAHPAAKVSVTGYADSATGNPTINEKYAAQRADAVYDALVNKYGIDAARITKDSKGGQLDLYGGNPEMNRVAICIAAE